MVYVLLLGQCTQVLVDKMRQDNNWVTISISHDQYPIFKLIKKSAGQTVQDGNVGSRHQSTLLFFQQDPVSNMTYYNQSTTRV